MKIIHDHHYSDDGVTLIATQHVDTEDPAFIALEAQIRDDVAAQEATGFLEPTSIPEHRGKTRWQVIQDKMKDAGR